MWNFVSADRIIAALFVNDCSKKQAARPQLIAWELLPIPGLSDS